MKRIIGLSFLFLANIVVLAHAVIPHHHHGKVCVTICDILSSGDASSPNHESCRLGCGEQAHAGHSSNEECILNELYTRSNELSSNSDDADFGNFHPDFPVVCCDTPLLKIRQYEELSFRQKPYINSYHTRYLTHSLGLRAPPSC